MRAGRVFIHAVRALALATALASGCGGSGNPPIRDVQKKFASAYCHKVDQCAAEASPGTAPEYDHCMARLAATNDNESICSEAIWDKCVSELSAAACPAQVPGKTIEVTIPASCGGC